jgi:hypothetical protein
MFMNTVVYSYTLADVRLTLPIDYFTYKSLDRSYGALNLLVNDNVSPGNQTLFDLYPYFTQIQLFNNSLQKYFYVYDNSK